MRFNPLSILRLKTTSVFNHWKRKLFFGKLGSSSSKRKNRSVNTRSLRKSIANARELLNTQGISFILAITLIFFLLLNLNQYFKIKLQPYNGETYTPRIVDSSNTNVLFIGYQSQDEYRYIDFLYFVNNQSGVLRGFAIDPSFVLTVDGDLLQVNSLLNVYDENVIESFITRIEFELGLRVDRYIAFDSESMSELLRVSYKGSLGQKLEDSKVIPDEDFLQFGNNQHDFINSLFSSYSSVREKLYYFWKVDDLARNFYTNFSKTEFITFLLKYDSSLKGTFTLKKDYGVLQPSGYFKVSSLLLDEALIPVFRDIRVVAEQSEVEVYNASNRSGLASQKSRELKIAGANVVKSGNYFEEVKDEEVEAIVYVNTKEDLKNFRHTIETIQRSMRGDISVKVGEYEYNQTGDLILVLL